MDERAERAEAFLKDQTDYYRAYHNHKESMAYAGFTLFAGVALWALVSREWPPDWGANSKYWAALSITALWFVVFKFLRFQLHRRRWAAIRAAGAERLRADWLQHSPTPDDLSYRTIGPERVPARRIQILDWFWPQEGAVHAVGVQHQVYPKCFVEAWLEQEKRGTDAISHERLIIATGWVVTILWLLRTLNA